MKYWFKRKRYGYGWTPSSGAGWSVTAVYMAAVILLAAGVLSGPQPASSVRVAICSGLFVFVTATFLGLAYRKAPRPEWRWGGKPADNPEEDS